MFIFFQAEPYGAGAHDNLNNPSHYCHNWKTHNAVAEGAIASGAVAQFHFHFIFILLDLSNLTFY